MSERDPLPFIIGKQYSRKDIYDILGVPKERRRGNWETGYTEYEGAFYIFVNVEVPGRTGYNYNDKWLPDGKLLWHAKTIARLGQPSLTRMINSYIPSLFFTRTDNRDVYFMFQGVGRVVEIKKVLPVEVIWEFADEESAIDSPEDVEQKKKNPRITMSMRNICLSHYGMSCYVCGFDFEKQYGSIGEGFIQVSYLNPAIRNESDAIDPITDLRPICPNCLAMIQRRPRASISMNDLKNTMNKILR